MEFRTAGGQKSSEDDTDPLVAVLIDEIDSLCSLKHEARGRIDNKRTDRQLGRIPARGRGYRSDKIFASAHDIVTNGRSRHAGGKPKSSGYCLSSAECSHRCLAVAH